MELLSWGEIIIRILMQLMPVWISLVVLFGLSIIFKRRLGLYGKLFDSTIGMIGFAIVMFWVFAGFYAGALDLILTHDPLSPEQSKRSFFLFAPLSNKKKRTPWEIYAPSAAGIGLMFLGCGGACCQKFFLICFGLSTLSKLPRCQQSIQPSQP